MNAFTTKELVSLARSEGVGPATQLLIRDELLLRSYDAADRQKLGEMTMLKRALAMIPTRRELARHLR